jgi:hypothetical protein
MRLPREEAIKSLSRFKTFRDNLLQSDTGEVEHHLQRFVNFCNSDPFVQQTLAPLLNTFNGSIEQWWKDLFEQADRRPRTLALEFPNDQDQELALRFLLLIDVAENKHDLWAFTHGINSFKLDEGKQRFLSLIVRPMCEELSDRLADAANVASPEVRALRAVPPNRIPGDNEIKIFLSHKTPDKPLVQKYHRVLEELGFSPWLDEREIMAGANLERELLKGFEHSCAAVFFITDKFVDENYLATEIDYAIAQTRKKGNKFAIVTLRFSEEYPIPGLLERFAYKTITDDIDGIYHIIRALPIELGLPIWKEQIVDK